MGEGCEGGVEGHISKSGESISKLGYLTDNATMLESGNVNVGKWKNNYCIFITQTTST